MLCDVVCGSEMFSMLSTDVVEVVDIDHGSCHDSGLFFFVVKKLSWHEP